MLENTYSKTTNKNDWWYIFSVDLKKDSPEKQKEQLAKYITLLARERIGDLDVHFRHCHEHILSQSRHPIGDEKATYRRFFNDIKRAGGTNIQDLCAHCLGLDSKTLPYSKRHDQELNKICQKYATRYFNEDHPTR